MFSGILSSDSEIIVFERNVSDLFFSNVPAPAVEEISAGRWWLMPIRCCSASSPAPAIPSSPASALPPPTRASARPSWIAGDRLNFAQHADDVVLGERAAEFLSANSADHVPIGHGVFHVIGMLKTANGFEDGGVFMPLASAQTFFHKEGTSSVITIKLRNKDDAAAFKSMVKAKYPNLIALEDAEFTRSYSQFRILKATAWAVGGCGLLLGGLGVANTMIMSVFTRIREIAILRVNGFSNAQIGGDDLWRVRGCVALRRACGTADRQPAFSMRSS